MSHDEFAPREINELLISGDFSKTCLSVGAKIRSIVEMLYKSKEDQLFLIERLLEPEKEKYGFLDSEICKAYRSLYEMRAELTGKPLPDKLPFEKDASFSVPSSVLGMRKGPLKM